MIKNIFRFCFAGLLLILFFSCVSFEENQGMKKNTINVDETADLSSIDVIAGKVTFVFTLEKYDREKVLLHSCRLNVSRNKELFNYMSVGTYLDDIPFFSGGTGLASSSNGKYEFLYISEKGNHYLVFDPTDKETKRVDCIKEFEDSGLVSLSLKSIMSEDKEIIPARKLKGQKLFLIFYFDRNLNDIVDKDEFKRITLNFK